MLSLFDKFKRDHFWGPFLKASGGTTKFSIHVYYSEQSLLLWRCFKPLLSQPFTVFSLNSLKWSVPMYLTLSYSIFKKLNHWRCTNRNLIVMSNSGCIGSIYKRRSPNSGNLHIFFIVTEKWNCSDIATKNFGRLNIVWWDNLSIWMKMRLALHYSSTCKSHLHSHELTCRFTNRLT